MRQPASPTTNRHQLRPSQLRRSSWSLAALIDQGFFMFAGMASFWLAWLVWRDAWSTGGWWLLGLFVVVWAITSYLALPRLHRVLSSWYVPNYFIGRTRTADGLLGDPVNVAARGSEAQLHEAMEAAGWQLADDITPRSVWKIIIYTLAGRSYATAPVSSLFLFGRRHDFAYQQEVDGNPRRRHHVRFWRCPQGWLLPGGHQVDWLAAGTYDRSVGVSLFTFQITHKIDENTDIERDYIVQTVRRGTPTIGLTLLRDFSTGYHSRNGGGDSIKTDGDLPVLELGDVPRPSPEHLSGIVDATSYKQSLNGYDTLLGELWIRRPPQILAGSVLLLVSVCIAAVEFGWWLVDWYRGAADGLLAEAETAAAASGWLWATALASVGFMVAEMWLVWLVMRGSDRARLVLLSVASLLLITGSLSVSVSRASWVSIGPLAVVALHIGVVLAFSADAARRFTQLRSRGGRAI